MANKKILYTGTDGKIRELASGSVNTVNYDDTPNAELVRTKNVSFTTMSFNNGNVGLPIIKNNVVTMLTASELDYVGWDNFAKTWKFMRGEYVNLAGLTASANSDLSGTYDQDIKVKSLSNVRSGTLGVQYGGTGLGSGSGNNSFTNSNESILLGNGSDAFAFLTASQATSPVVLVSDGVNWNYITQSIEKGVEVMVYTQPNVYAWTASAATKAIRIIAQGAGGGGGSGANRNSAVAALGGAGGSAGAFVDTGVIIPTTQSASIIVGAGGDGGVFSSANNSGISGVNGQSSSFGDIIFANGGSGGGGGNINSSTISNGGASNSPINYVYDNFIYNAVKSLKNGGLGADNTTTVGDSGPYSNGAGGGAAAGSLLNLSYTTNYEGGDRSYLSNESGADPITLLHFKNNNNSVNNSVDLIVYSPNILSASDKKFGVSSMYCAANASGYGTVNNFASIFSQIGTGNFTVEMWMKKLSAITGCLMGILLPGGGATFQSNFDNTVRFFGGTTTLLTNLNQWNHVAVVRRSGTMYCYINGVRNLETIAYASDLSTIAQFRIGGYYSGNAVPFHGYIDEFAIYPYAKYTDTTLSIPTEEYGTSKTSSSLTSSLNISSNNFLINSQASDILLTCGGTGGASAAVTEGLGDVLALAHHNITNPLKDNSIWNSQIITGSSETIRIVPSASLPAQLNGAFLDGFLSSSQSGSTSVGGYYPYTLTGGMSKTGDFSIESWFYLINTGSLNTTEPNFKSCLLTAGRTSTAGSGLQLWTNKDGRLIVFNATATATIHSSSHFITGSNLNQWNHIVMQATGTTYQVYLNGTGSSISSVRVPTLSGDISYGYSRDYPYYNFNGYAKELRVLNRAQTQQEIQNYYNGCIAGDSGSFADPDTLQSYSGGLGGNGAWGSGGGGGGASTNYTGSLTRQGGNGGDGYVAVISYKY